MKTIDIYTDGACSGNPGPGGYGAILMYKGHRKEISGGKKDTTNNQMELQAAISALSQLKEKCHVKLYSDSAYLVNAFNLKWVYGWEKNNFRKKDKSPVKNIPLWKELLKYDNLHDIEWIKVKGHSDNEFNNRCDELAVEKSLLFKNKG